MIEIFRYDPDCDDTEDMPAGHRLINLLVEETGATGIEKQNLVNLATEFIQQYGSPEAAVERILEAKRKGEAIIKPLSCQ